MFVLCARSEQVLQGAADGEERMLDNEVAFVIVSWNSGEVLNRSIKSIERQATKAMTVIVVDNDSTDGTPAHVRAMYPWVRLIDAGANMGFPAGANLGIAAAFENPACRYVVLLNDDAWLGDSWLREILAFAERHPDGAGFQGLTVDGTDASIIDSYGLAIGQAGRAIQLGYRSRDPSPASGEVFGVNAAAALYRRTFLETQPFGTQYLDADLVMYLEDVDLAARAVVMGWRNYFVSSAVAYHLGSGDDREDRHAPLLMAARNDVLVLVKNLPWAVVLRTLPGMLHSDLARYKGFLKAGQYRSILTMLRGRALGLAKIPRFMRKRSLLRGWRSTSSDRLWELMGRVLPLPDPTDPAL